MNTNRDWRLEVIDCKNIDNVNCKDQWQELVTASENLYAPLQSLEWIESLNILTEEVYVCFLYSPGNTLEGIAPISIKNHKIKFDISAKTFFHFSIKTINFVGSIPLLKNNKETHNIFFDLLSNHFPMTDGFYFDSVPTSSFIWENYLQSNKTRSQYLLHIPEGLRMHYGLSFPASFDIFLNSLSKNRRKDFKKRLTKFMQESNENPAPLKRIDKAEHVSSFIKDATTISRQSWQNKTIGNRITQNRFNEARLLWLAKKGILRSYVLYCNNTPCAFRLGYQLGDIYYGFESGYDANFIEFSPGIMMTLKMLEDFSQERPPKTVDFGIGEAQWKKDFCNYSREDSSVFLLKRTFKNKLATNLQITYYKLIECCKNFLLNRKNT